MTELSRISVSTPGDLVALVPYLLGFPPQESVVVCWFGAKALELTVRVNIDACLEPHLSSMLQQGLERTAASSLVLLCFTDDEETGVAALEACMRAAPVECRDVIVVAAGRWRSLNCDDEQCCPSFGTPVSSCAPSVTKAVVAGLALADSREAIVARVEGPDRELREAMNALLAAEPVQTCLDERSWVVETLRREALDPQELARPEIARVLVELLDIETRDAVLGHVTADNAHAFLAVFETLVRHAPPLFAAAPLTLCGFAAWLAGEGVLLTSCVDRLDHLDPDYRLGAILAEIHAAAIPPTSWQGWDDAA